MGVENSVHTDTDVAARSVFGGVVAPLAMLDVGTKPGLVYERNVSDPQGAAFEALDRAGLTAGQPMPPMSVPVTATLMVAECS